MSQSQQTEAESSQLTHLNLFDSEADDLLFLTHCPATPSTFRQVDSFSFVQPSIPSSIAPDFLERFQRVGPVRYRRSTLLARGLERSTLTIHHYQPAPIPTRRKSILPSPNRTIGVSSSFKPSNRTLR
ncbi:hypothetical protein AAEP93_007039 [Penicillium crustosum]